MTQAKKAVKLLAGATAGFVFFFLTSHPASHVKKKLPQKRYKNLSLLPNVRYSKEEKMYHIHHWLILTIFYVPLLTSKKLRKSHIFHGIFLGSIIQGLFYKDRFKFSYPKQ